MLTTPVWKEAIVLTVHSVLCPVALRELVEGTVPDEVRQATRVRMEVAVGNPAEAIPRAGRERRAELIVMDTHGRGGLRKLLLGSTAEQVLRRAETAVLVVPMSAVGASDHAQNPHEQRHHERIEGDPTTPSTAG